MDQLHADDPASIGPYRVVARLGAGGMGRVYLCSSPGGRRLAVKVIRSELADDALFRARFRREVATAKRVQSHVTAAVVDADTESALPWLATVYLDGPTLAAAVQLSPLTEPELHDLSAYLAEALQSIHGVGLVHRDLKPSNIILAPDGPRVIDFGIARAADATALTSTNLRVGSPGYMAPEQIRSDVAGPASDVFALGAVLAYAATGRSPFGEGPTDLVLFRVLHEEPNLGGLPPSVRPLVAACLAKDPTQRPTPDQIVEGSWVRPSTLVLPEPTPGQPGPAAGAATAPIADTATGMATLVDTHPDHLPRRRARRRAVAFATTAILLLGAGAAWAAQPWRQRPAPGAVAAPPPAGAPTTGAASPASVTTMSSPAVVPTLHVATSARPVSTSRPRPRPQPFRYDPAAFRCRPFKAPEVAAEWQVAVAGAGVVRAGDALDLGLRNKFGNFPETLTYREPLSVDVRVYLPDGSSQLAHTSVTGDAWANVTWPGDFPGADALYAPGTYTVVWTEGLGANRYLSCDGFVAQ